MESQKRREKKSTSVILHVNNQAGHVERGHRSCVSEGAASQGGSSSPLRYPVTPAAIQNVLIISFNTAIPCCLFAAVCVCVCVHNRATRPLKAKRSRHIVHAGSLTVTSEGAYEPDVTPWNLVACCSKKKQLAAQFKIGKKNKIPSKTHRNISS